MANVPKDLRYTREHEWAKLEGASVRVGITAYAQEQLGDVVFVELPKVGAKVAARQPFGVVESVKAVSDLFAPVTGQVAEVNGDLPNAPEEGNQDPYGRGGPSAAPHGRRSKRRPCPAPCRHSRGGTPARTPPPASSAPGRTTTTSRARS